MNAEDSALILLAPHPDDELIGCSLLLPHVDYVFYLHPHRERMEIPRQMEAERVAEHFGFRWRFVHVSSLFDHPWGDAVGELLDEKRDVILLVPDPMHEHHPFHKEVGWVGVSRARSAGIRVVTYSTNMEAPYVRELPRIEAEKKRGCLNQFYPSQKSLWEMDYRYWLFEGCCEWNPRI